MEILSGLFRSRDKPTARTAGSSYSFFLGGTASGKYVTERSEMQMTAVYCCVRILSEAVASLPLQFYRYTDDGGKEKAVEHTLYFLLHDEPNPDRRSTIELYHGSVKRYKASVGQQQYLQNRLHSRKPLKLFSCEAFLEYVGSCFFGPVRHWSLDACFGRVLLEGRFDHSEMVCTQTLYRYVSPGLLPVKNIDLPQKLRRKTAGTRTRKHRILFGRSIEERPSSYADRRHFGYWEIDWIGD